MKFRNFPQILLRSTGFGLAVGLIAGISALNFKPIDVPARQQKALLWEITGKGLTQPSYLYGTIHAICPADFVMTDAIRNKLKTAGQVALEFDLDDPNMGQEMMQNISMKDGSTLKSLYTPAEYQQISDYFKTQIGMEISNFNTWQPLMLNTLLISKMIGCDPQSYEMTFLKMAQEQNKEIIGLETITDQLQVFAKIPAKKQAELLLKGITEQAEGKKEFGEMVALYRQQDLEGFQKMFIKYSDEIPGFQDLLLVARNRNWIPVIEREAREKSTFFAVGAGHLGGKEGVLQLLQDKGYTLKAVKL